MTNKRNFRWTLCLLAGAFLIALAVPAGAQMCGVFTCTWVGTSGNDTFYGSSGRDVLCGLAGKDIPGRQWWQRQSLWRRGRRLPQWWRR
jgi:hypothetical protein